MKTRAVLVIAGTLLLLSLQVLLFGEFNKELLHLGEQVARTQSLQTQLTQALDTNSNLTRLYKALDDRLEEAYSALAAIQQPSEAAGRARLRGSAAAAAGAAALKSSRQVAGDDAAAAAAAAGIGSVAGGHAGARRIYPSGNEAEACVGGPHGTAGVVAAVVSVVFNRADYLRRHAASLLRVHGQDPANRERFPLFFSQDGTPPHDATREAAQSYDQVSYLHHRELVAPVVKRKIEKVAYYRIAAHYRFILKTFFDCFQYPRLIILEEDMELAPDFFAYFGVLAPLLDADPSLMCISSWNDHGQAKFVRDVRRLYRSDFFPGLGWMLRNELWQEIKEAWPESYWDDWLRDNRTRRGRQCVRPEVCRTYNFGKEGSSKGMFYNTFLAPIRLADEAVPWDQLDLSNLARPRYDEELRATLAAAPLVTSPEEAGAAVGDVRLQYDSQQHYERLAAGLGMLQEWRDGVPRGAYNGTVVIRYQEARIFLEPSPSYQMPVLNPDEYVKVDANGAIVRDSGGGRL